MCIHSDANAGDQAQAHLLIDQAHFKSMEVECDFSFRRVLSALWDYLKVKIQLEDPSCQSFG